MKYFLILLLVVSCASHQTLPGGTFKETKVRDNIYEVTLAGGENNTPAQVTEMLHFRCAQLAVKNGFKYFAILKDQEKVEHHLPVNGKFAIRDDEFIHSAQVQFSMDTIQGKQNYNAEEVISSYK